MWLLNSYKNVTVLISVMKELKPGQETLARMDYLEEKTGFREKREKNDSPLHYDKDANESNKVSELRIMHGELNNLQFTYGMKNYADICDLQEEGRYGEAFNKIDEIEYRTEPNKNV